MEVATSVLYIEAALDDAALTRADRADRVPPPRAPRRCRRAQPAVRAAGDWMEELYRRVSDRQTLGSVVHELRASLSEVERQCDEYFRDPSQRAKLIPVPASCRPCAACSACSAWAGGSGGAAHAR